MKGNWRSYFLPLNRWPEQEKQPLSGGCYLHNYACRSANSGTHSKRFSPRVSGDYVRNDLVFEFSHLVFDGELFLLHALNTQLIAANRNHGIDRSIEVFMLVAQPRRYHSQFRLFLIGHATSPHFTTKGRRDNDRIIFTRPAILPGIPPGSPFGST